jgi:hypothetical protein
MTGSNLVHDTDDDRPRAIRWPSCWDANGFAVETYESAAALLEAGSDYNRGQ